MDRGEGGGDVSVWDKVDLPAWRFTRADGVIVEEQCDMFPVASAGRLVTVDPAVVELRDGSTVTPDGWLAAGVAPRAGDDVLLLRIGALVLILGRLREF